MYNTFDFLSNIENNLKEEKSSKAIDITLDTLVKKSQQTLEQILDDPQISIQEKAEIALKIIQIAKSDTRETEAIEEREIISETNSLIETKPIKETFPLTVAEKQIVNNLALNNISAIKTKISSDLSQTEKKQNREFKGFQKELVSEVKTKFFPAEYLQIENFLEDKDYQQVLDTAFSKQAEFVNSKTVTNTANYRQSSILYATLFPELYYLVKKKITNTIPLVLKKLGHPKFEITRVEMQMTAHGDGCFYKVHTDAGSKKTETRELTYVYYFYQKPKQFSGGELKIYDTEMKNNSFKQKERSQTIEPLNNSIVFFNSRCKHEVLPISCDSEYFQYSRFTLNGWLRR